VVLQWTLTGDGHRIWIAPDAKLRHANETDIVSILKGYFMWNRCFAPLRARVFHWSPAKRLTWIVLSPLIPFVRATKLVAYMTRQRPQVIGKVLRYLPTILVIQAGAAAGQAVGLLFGIGGTDVAFLKYEMNQYRDIPGVETVKV
jgi:hypothetical protein